MFLNQRQERNDGVKLVQTRRDYFRTYYLKNREKLLAYSKKAYQVKKLVAPFLEKKTNSEKGVKKSFSSHTHAFYTSNSIISYKDAFFFDGGGFAHHARERQKRKNQAWRRIATQNKRPVKGVRGWNLPEWREERNHYQLFQKYGEISTLTGKKLGNYYHSTLDFDLNKVDYPPKMIAKLFKEFTNLLKHWGVSWDETKKGGHVDLLTAEPLPNEPIYYRGWGKVWEIGEVKSKGGYVVDVDKDKSFVRNGKWYKKFGKDSHEELKKELGFFFFELGSSNKGQLEEKSNWKMVASIKPIESQKVNQIAYQLTTGEILTIQGQLKSSFKLLINGQTYYRYNLDKSPYFFLFNTYNGSSAPPFRVGESCRFQLKRGYKHPYFYRLLKKAVDLKRYKESYLSC